MKLIPSFISGLAGAGALTLLHQWVKKRASQPPQMDKLGMQAMEKAFAATDMELPSRDELYDYTLAGDLAANAAYYALVGTKPGSSILTGSVLGIVAGTAAVALPGKLKLNPEYSGATPQTKALTIALYTAGGLVAGTVYQWLKKK
ncbi:hypothetical protein HNQ91_002395 [Filimonas zeae]|uniref:Uncharacterized protein n=1 Tax=Filimonas zeae TaxID=1737353 RepID=A0A917IUM1_9BACT|nr:hypothetical protein [Filimonas zeae]MDR6339344.1 hypothetical protein [Filimonas zeae]GGH64022.1 hypothetical protein GCM10011379_15590 [Filimonas zeae]